MYITKVDLENIKSHAKSTFDFRKGTTAIIGENGAGKTTLIEAIAWTMFDLLDYKKDAFVKRGAKKGVARVSFESNLDERTYLVHRDTGTGYYVYDPEINTRVADKKDEVLRFLRQHMGVEPGTDLEALFRSAIGVPQGTFTSIFLETPTERKRTFDRLLKVEEYRQSSDKLIDTVNYLKGLQIDLDNKIAFAEGKLEGYSDLTESHKKYKQEAAGHARSLKKVAKELETLTKTVSGFEAKAKEIEEIRNEIEKLDSDIARTGLDIAGKEADLRNSREASQKTNASEEAHLEHLKALGMITELERERTEREKLNKTIAEIDTALVKVRSDQKKFNEDLERILAAHRRLEELKPKIAEQATLEKSLEESRTKLAEVRSAENRAKDLDEELSGLREKYREAQATLKDAEERAKGSERLPDFIGEDDRLRERVAELEGRLEVDRRFQSEVRNGLCPILTQKCLNLKEGETLEGYLTSQFKELSGEISAARGRQKKLKEEIAGARNAESFAARIEPLRLREEEIAADGKRLKDLKETVEKKIAGAVSLEKELEGIDKRLKELDNPKATAKLLQAEAEKEISARQAITGVESNLERLESDRKQKAEQLEIYKDLEFNWKKYTELRDKTAESHKTYISNEKQAGLLENREKELLGIKKGLAKIEVSKTKLAGKAEKASEGFDRDEYNAARLKLSELQNEETALKVNFDNADTRRAELDAKIGELKTIRDQLRKDKTERERLERVGKATAFIRSTLKSAAPRVAQNYVFHVSIEANRMFREITGNAEHTLKWENDYGIALEEGGYDRPFQNLSGGEQMAAALSVRLALLRQLSDIKLAFFDEPTTNLDLERRERLAEQISQITESRTFEQLFVISHDDTFEGYVDNVIAIEADED